MMAFLLYGHFRDLSTETALPVYCAIYAVVPCYTDVFRPHEHVRDFRIIFVLQCVSLPLLVEVVASITCEHYPENIHGLSENLTHESG